MSHHESHSSGNSSITRDEFQIMALKRMIARRGCPTEIWRTVHGRRLGKVNQKRKNSLNTVLLTKNPTEEVLNTLLAEVEYTAPQRVRLEQPRAVARLSTASRYVLSRWLREYLPELQHRREPHGRGEALKIGDVVLIADNTLPRNTWPRGVITAVYPGTDGVTRVADVQTKNGVLRRPTKKIVVILTGPAVLP
ncbi:hypothetical protein EVAR_31901_1 [Eumeta japonica]|uniref:DUF5641 domain-containing protein n=1 Tax=Eumeta variegata TaxID=151549 RepID=A0A4C1XRI5_EUMVA|nr:hypothetical protein EVAR_31901_1 [Eumeta japonica]